jgi:hypothetical protein
MGLIYYANFTIQSTIIIRERRNETVINNILSLTNPPSNLIIIIRKFRGGSTFKNRVSAMLRHDKQI